MISRQTDFAGKPRRVPRVSRNSMNLQADVVPSAMHNQARTRQDRAVATSTIVSMIACAVLVVVLVLVSTGAVCRQRACGTSTVSTRTSALATEPAATGTTAPRPVSASMSGPRRAKNLVVIGAGLVAASMFDELNNAWRERASLREATEKCGGRTLSIPRQTAPVSTISTPREFAAWIYHPFVHMQTTRYLRSVNCNTTTLQLRTPQSFTWSPTTGRRPFAHLPDCLPGESFGACAGAAAAGGERNAAALQWFAHTGFWPADAPAASASLLRAMDLPNYGRVVTGFGWQDATLRGIAFLPVIYDRRLTSIDIISPSPASVFSAHNGASDAMLPNSGPQQQHTASDVTIRLEYATGDVEMLSAATNAVVLTVPPMAMTRIRGMPSHIVNLIERAFVTVPVGILYASWPTTKVWWPAAGLIEGVAATSLPIGRVFVVSGNDLRCQMTGAADVEYWTTKVIAEGGTDSAQAAVAEQLSQVFNMQVPAPASVSFQPWPQGVALWTARVDNAAASLTLARPFGEDTPIYWASSDLSRTPGWVEGAIDAGVQCALQLMAT